MHYFSVLNGSKNIADFRQAFFTQPVSIFQLLAKFAAQWQTSNRVILGQIAQMPCFRSVHNAIMDTAPCLVLQSFCFELNNIDFH